jgi:DNA polymerase-3 subunit delta
MQDVAETVDEKTVERYYAGRVQTTSYTVIDAALAGQTGEALKLFRHAVNGGLDVVPMVAAVGAKMRLMARVYENRSATIAQLGGQAWMIDKARRQVAGWTEDGLANVIQEIAVCDAAAKGAERDPEFAMERLLMMIARKGLKVV